MSDFKPFFSYCGGDWRPRCDNLTMANTGHSKSPWNESMEKELDEAIRRLHEIIKENESEV